MNTLNEMQPTEYEHRKMLILKSALEAAQPKAVAIRRIYELQRHAKAFDELICGLDQISNDWLFKERRDALNKVIMNVIAMDTRLDTFYFHVVDDIFLAVYAPTQEDYDVFLSVAPEVVPEVDRLYDEGLRGNELTEAVHMTTRNYLENADATISFVVESEVENIRIPRHFWYDDKIVLTPIEMMLSKGVEAE